MAVAVSARGATPGVPAALARGDARRSATRSPRGAGSGDPGALASWWHGGIGRAKGRLGLPELRPRGRCRAGRTAHRSPRCGAEDGPDPIRGADGRSRDRAQAPRLDLRLRRANSPALDG